MQVIVSFDVEIWCNGWTRLDEEFPRAFERYVYGHSRDDGAALPATLDILRRHGIRGVFFVEPLFAARFGLRYLKEIVDLIAAGGHSIELHLHSEWADEIHPRPLPDVEGKRQHLNQLGYEEQLALIRLGKSLLHEAGVDELTAFRAGNFAANSDTFRALEQAGLRFDSSMNATVAASLPDLRGSIDPYQPSRVGRVLSVPVSVFRDGFGRLRPAQIGACSFDELHQAIAWASAHAWPTFMLVSHNFEMLRPDSTRCDPVVLRRFERLCACLASAASPQSTSGNPFDAIVAPTRQIALAQVSQAATARRFGEQLLRRALPA